jgi:hypothetical protein
MLPALKIPSNFSINNPDNTFRRLLTATYFPVVFLMVISNTVADKKDLVGIRDGIDKIGRECGGTWIYFYSTL